MKRLVVGGNFGEPKKSGVAKKLAQELFADICNGGDLNFLNFSKRAVVDYDLVVWMPNIDNEVPKDYPVKKTGSVLICSKVLHDGRNTGDAVARIFKMNANAVIAISTEEENSFTFKLIDALGNLWVKTDDISVLSSEIERLAYWTKLSIRKNSEYCPDCVDTERKVEQKFCDIVKTIATRVENERGGRYFGNASTRCSFMFPTKRMRPGLPHCPGGNVNMLVSKRNMPKEHLKPEDFVQVYEIDEKLLYKGDFKPSVDSPVQLELYKLFPTMNYAIHGHAYIKGALMTKHYYPCGDLREVDAIKEMVEPKRDLIEDELGLFCLNLKNHGFIIMAENLEDLEELVDGLEFEYRQLEEKI